MWRALGLGAFKSHCEVQHPFLLRLNGDGVQQETERNLLQTWPSDTLAWLLHHCFLLGRTSIVIGSPDLEREYGLLRGSLTSECFRELSTAARHLGTQSEMPSFSLTSHDLEPGKHAVNVSLRFESWSGVFQPFVTSRCRYKWRSPISTLSCLLPPWLPSLVIICDHQVW